MERKFKFTERVGIARQKEYKVELELVAMELSIKMKEKNGVVVISDGKAKFLELPTYGKVEIMCHAGEVRQVKRENIAKFQ